jgi:hypothetical protein
MSIWDMSCPRSSAPEGSGKQAVEPRAASNSRDTSTQLPPIIQTGGCPTRSSHLYILPQLLSLILKRDNVGGIQYEIIFSLLVIFIAALGGQHSIRIVIGFFSYTGWQLLAEYLYTPTTAPTHSEERQCKRNSIRDSILSIGYFHCRPGGPT